MDDATLERYARLFHEQGRLTVNAERAKPFDVRPWEERTPEQKEIDLRGASAVAAAVLRLYEDEREEASLARLSRSVKLAQIRAYCRRRADLGDPAEAKVLAHILGIIGSEEENQAK